MFVISWSNLGNNYGFELGMKMIKFLVEQEIYFIGLKGQLQFCLDRYDKVEGYGFDKNFFLNQYNIITITKGSNLGCHLV